jgi:hypothetical protein
MTIEERRARDRAYYQKRREHIRAMKRVSQKRLRVKRADYMRALKEGRACSICGGTPHFSAMDFHHVQPANKRENVSIIVGRGWSMDSIHAEMAKCDLVCANCHRYLHWQEKEAAKAEAGARPQGLPSGS